MPSRSRGNSRSRNTRSRSTAGRSSSSSRRSGARKASSRRASSTRSTSTRSSSSRSQSSRSKSGAQSRSRRTAARASSRATSARSRARRSSAASRPLTDREEIRQWAEERGAHPACVRGTGGGEDVGMIRLDVPGYSGEQSLEPIEWDEWFEKFDDSGLALLVQETTAGGQKSNFNKLVSRETAEQANRGRGSSTKKSSGRSGGGSSRRRAA